MELRIIDKNTDFYDYIQGIYRDDTVVFDRTDSFILSKDMVCSKLHRAPEFLLLQVCNTFWLFFVEVTKRNDYGFTSDYAIDYLGGWKNYTAKRELIKMNTISFRGLGFGVLTSYSKTERRFVYDKDKVISSTAKIIDAIKTNNYRIEHRLDVGRVIAGDGSWYEKHIPILKECGIVKYINPQDIYLAFEEYFLAEKTASERTESVGITDKEKIENHGFDTKTSFRGK